MNPATKYLRISMYSLEVAYTCCVTFVQLREHTFIPSLTLLNRKLRNTSGSRQSKYIYS